jgi:hypothetical protein
LGTIWWQAGGRLWLTSAAIQQFFKAQAQPRLLITEQPGLNWAARAWMNWQQKMNSPASVQSRISSVQHQFSPVPVSDSLIGLTDAADAAEPREPLDCRRIKELLLL